MPLKPLLIALSVVTLGGVGLAFAVMPGHARVSHESWSDSAPQGAVLVELFTSEGCSSCPPADALLRDIDGSHAPNGELIVGLSEHVTYWNNLGWKDPFSEKFYTDRQSAYAARFGLDSVYTPQAVVNGTTQIVGSDRASLDRALHGLPTPALHLKQLNATRTPDGYDLAWALSGQPPEDAEVYAIVADDMDDSNVQRGENSGRSLTHVAVARSFARVAPAQPGEGQTAHLKLGSNLLGNDKPRHLIVLVQERNAGRVLAVATHAL